MKYEIKRPINGISINGCHSLLDENGKVLQLTLEQAIDALGIRYNVLDLIQEHLDFKFELVRRVGTLTSSHGELDFDVPSGDIIAMRTCSGSDGDYLKFITRVDVDEWEKTYPGEDVANCHDILDFGTWYLDTGSGKLEYGPPCYSWREELRDTRQENDPILYSTCPRCGMLAEGYFSRIEPMGCHCEHCGEAI